MPIATFADDTSHPSAQDYWSALPLRLRLRPPLWLSLRPPVLTRRILLYAGGLAARVGAIIGLCGGNLMAPCVLAQPLAPASGWAVSATGETIDQYYPFRLARSGTLIDQITGEPSSRWESRPVSPSLMELTWGVPKDWPGPDAAIEEFELKPSCAGGRGFLWLNAYRDPKHGHRYAIETTRAEISIESGPWLDITSGGACGTRGQPYALADVVQESYSMRVWGNVYDIHGKVGRRFFWQHTISRSATEANGCWRNEPQAERPTLIQLEAWWDSTFGWMQKGGGRLGSNGEPTGENVHYVRGQMIARDLGPGWLAFGTVNYCLLDVGPAPR